MTDTPEIKLDSWSKRRRVLYLSLETCGVSILFGALNPYLSPEVATTLITYGFSIGAVLVSTYVFAATLDDKFKGIK